MRRFPRLAEKELKILQKLSTPGKVQDFLNKVPFNFENEGETCRSPLESLRHKEMHCMEGALLAAAAFWYHGQAPLLLNLKTVVGDDDHTVALFKKGKLWGAVTKTNHAVLRYRDPVYANPRELAMSYFNEYFLHNGTKTMYAYSEPFDLSKWKGDWLTSQKNLWGLAKALFHSPHTRIISPAGLKRLRKADLIEREAGKLVDWE